ncbi:MAG: glycosyltransferase [Tannerella sp.]|nr:glycosyltransferase [Tannerella sp.]
MADVGVVPSLFEPFGYVAVEMMMHRLPVVVTATSGMNEVMDDTCGLKVPELSMLFIMKKVENLNSFGVNR